MTLNFRLLNLLGFLGCVFGLLFALYLQHFRGYEPCPFCIFQRVAMLATGLVFLAAAIQGPKAWGQWVYVFLSSLAALVGAGIAARHVWLQSLPPDQVPACGPTLDYLLDMMPLQEVVTTVLKGDGNCAKIDAQWLGISLPGWTLISFIGFVVYAVLTPILPKFLRKSA
ncbi:disulfide bond formation protein B [Solimonas fluminis]|uniref:Disulfide bond formation protein B n=1 Tax=Solimonas fluminis TaxID=2086571 RepID=A0A2S5TDT5_9GAMM|nr:disulfide bond formation protein B [Solimonas fluminis]PPE73145.1 disulfide bond formation protein B [Solimonas fluminis]